MKIMQIIHEKIIRRHMVKLEKMITKWVTEDQQIRIHIKIREITEILKEPKN